jgi:fatty acid-binding protein DegV
VQLLHAAKDALPGAAIRVKEGGPVLSSILGAGAVSISWGPNVG